MDPKFSHSIHTIASSECVGTCAVICFGELVQRILDRRSSRSTQHTVIMLDRVSHIIKDVGLHLELYIRDSDMALGDSCNQSDERERKHALEDAVGI